MKATKKLLQKANSIAAKYSKWILPQELQNMYAELNAIGVSTGAIYNDNKSCEWYYEGEEIENSYFCYSVYKDSNPNNAKNEYTIYFS